MSTLKDMDVYFILEILNPLWLVIHAPKSLFSERVLIREDDWFSVNELVLHVHVKDLCTESLMYDLKNQEFAESRFLAISFTLFQNS